MRCILPNPHSARQLRKTHRYLLEFLSHNSVVYCGLNNTAISAHAAQAGSKESVFGGVAEWSIAAVLKTVEAQASGGSNPSPSAITCG